MKGRNLFSKQKQTNHVQLDNDSELVYHTLDHIDKAAWYVIHEIAINRKSKMPQIVHARTKFSQKSVAKTPLLTWGWFTGWG